MLDCFFVGGDESEPGEEPDGWEWLLRPVMADWPSALVTDLIAALLYLLTSPLVEAAERRRTRRQEADG